MFGQTAAPHPLLGPKRYSKELPIEIEQIPYIDAIILSHDHYDHLDYGSIQQLKDKVGAFYTPLGVGNHLRSWGVQDSIIHELDWWDSIMLDNIQLVCAPAQHFSGRGLFDRATTLWSSWVVKADSMNVYFSGDGGYGPHFKEIGEKYGPFNISLMECGQYNEDWKAIHMMPEETVQAAVDLNSNYFTPIHWAGFTLAFHDWDEPVIRAATKAQELNIPMLTPKIGEQILLDHIQPTPTKWWEDY
jgi:L-ascorbate metabolism protein UlaG (beta-lactamase superfamily)